MAILFTIWLWCTVLLLNHELCVFGSKLEFALPEVDYMEIPTAWWDAEADKSLLIGVYKHGRLEVLKNSYPL